MPAYLPSHEPTTPPAFPVPAGACDCHFHVFDEEERFPLASGAGFVPVTSSLARWQRMAATIGAQRGVLVQASPYGTDNRLLLHVLAKQPSLRGVAAPSPDIDDAELLHMHALGVRGLRANLYRRRDGMRYPGGLDLVAASQLLPRVAGLGWHLELFVNVARDLVEFEPQLRALPPVPLVFCHMGCPDEPAQVRSAGFERLLAMVAEGRSYAKLSGIDRLCPDPRRYDNARPVFEALLHTNAERLLWGSNWPHPHVDAHMADDGVLFQRLHDWVGDAAILRKILVDNPAHLYDFPSPDSSAVLKRMATKETS